MTIKKGDKMGEEIKIFEDDKYNLINSIINKKTLCIYEPEK